jgi:glycerol kinase
VSEAVCVIDVGTSSVRAALVDERARIVDSERRPLPPATPAPGLVEFDPEALADAAIDLATTLIARHGGRVAAVGVSNQRASCVLWDRATGRALAPGIGWQDLRTVGECLELRARTGLVFAPNQTATKATWLLANTARHDVDPCIGTVDAWIVHRLTLGACHVTDPTNAMVTGLARIGARGTDWNDEVLAALGIDREMLPMIATSVGTIGVASALPGSPPIAGILGDQQASLIGQGCVVPGSAKITFGTGAMADVCTGPAMPNSLARSGNGTFPIVTVADAHGLRFGVEAIMLAAGTNVEWLVDDLGIVPDAAATDDLAASVPDSDGVVFVPALLGLGTPRWDYGARGTLLGLTRGTTAAHVTRAVLDGIAHRGADLIEAAEADTGLAIEVVNVDGGMSRNTTFIRCLADATGRPVAVAATTEATTVGAAVAAGVATGLWPSLEDAAARISPDKVVEPSVDSGDARALSRQLWSEAISRASGWIPELSALDF